MTAWPYPTDDRADRRARVARAYRDALAAADPKACAELDAAMRGFGQTWILDTDDTNPDDLLTTAEAAALADVSESTIRMWAHRGILQRAASSQRAALYRWADIQNAQRGNITALTRRE